MTDLGIIPGGLHSYAYGINDAGQVVGQCVYGGTNFHHAFLWNGVMQDLGTLATPYNAGSYASAINANGQVVGWADTSSGGKHAFLGGLGGLNDLGTLGGGGSQAFGINRSGQVVGSAGVSGGGSHAFLYSGGVMYDLNSLLAQKLPTGEMLVTTVGINDRGQILANSSVYGYLLTPVPPPAGVDLLLLQ
jgi:chitinase